jgi:glutaminyl-peptide cyclotransferase
MCRSKIKSGLVSYDRGRPNMRVVACLFLLTVALLPARPVAQGGSEPTYGYRIVNVYPHDVQAYTQGLVFIDGYFFESTGLLGRSTLRKVEPATGRVVQQRPIDAKYFAEGLTEWKGQLVQLTWKSGLGFVYDRTTFAPVRTFDYVGEGWGLTHDGTSLILSDGSSSLRFLSPVFFQETKKLAVRDRGVPVSNLNELEFVRGEIFANVWHTDRIARISPASGDVISWIDLTGLLAPGAVTDQDAVLNGIAYDAVRDRLFVTGKLWPKIFEIQLERRR